MYRKSIGKIKVRSVVSIMKLKNFAREKLTKCEIAREFILEEKDQMTSEEFVLKIGVWLRLVNKDLRRELNG